MTATILKIVFSLALAYAILAVFAFTVSERVIFPAPPASYDAELPDLVWLESSDGVRLAAQYLRDPSADLTLLYSHGNAEDIGYARAALEELRALGFSVLAYDYRGYGLSEDEPSERGSYRDIDAAYDFLVHKVGLSPEQIIIHGVSVGSGPSVDLATRRPVGGLILESPFTTAFRVMTHAPLFPFDRFRNIDKIRDVEAPVLVIHGTHDEVISHAHGLRIYEAANSPKDHLWVEGAGHNDLRWVAGPAYAEALQEFARTVRSRTEAHEIDRE